VFVHGEAGVGKTRLVRRVCDEASGKGFVVLWGQCVRFGAVNSPYLPLVSALEGWVETANAEELAEIIEAVDGAAELLPSFSGHASERPTWLLAVVEGLVAAIASRHPTVLVVDDLQWADLASRDALAYLIAGFRRQRLAVLTTHRDEELVAGHAMHSWLAELRRMPAVVDLRLTRLTRDETEQQLALLMGGQPQPRLVAEVVVRSDGNPYLSELLVRGLTSEDELLPPGLPVELTDALLAAWHRLSAPARETTRMLAVAGRPATVNDLTTVAATQGTEDESVRAALAEATNQGILIAQGVDACWFRHPLLAEVLSATLPPGAAAPIHTAWATTLEASSRVGIDEVRRQGDLALHYEAANNLEAGLRASLLAAELAQKVKAPQEAAVHLRRAARLWPVVHQGKTADQRGEVRLMEDLARTSYLVGDGEASLAAWSRALELVNPDSDPLRSSRLLIEWYQVAFELGRLKGQPLAEASRAVELSRAFPDSGEHAEALATLSSAEAWSNEPQAAQEHAEAALRAAQRSGDSAALSSAFNALALAYRRQQPERAAGFIELALQFAQASGDPEVIAWAAIWRHHHLRYRGDLPEIVRAATVAFQAALKDGAVQGAIRLAYLLAHQLLTSGRLSESSEVLREGLALTGVASASAGIRLDAALLATRRGELESARMHLRRAKELIPSVETRPGLMAPPILAEYLLARHQPERALDMLARTMPLQSTDSRIADEMLVWGARAAADLAQHSRDHHDRERVRIAKAALDRLVALHETLPQPPFEVLFSEDLVQPAMAALFEAEKRRCVGERVTSTSWEEAVRSCEAAGMRWEQMIASWRWAHALLGEGVRSSSVATTLRTVYQFATTSGARPLLQQALTLAAIAKITLDEPATTPHYNTTPAAFSTLTKRELEVLSHLVAGRTYGEIASTLFISEKTVSVHVSNLLRKTGTSSRREVSALALRLGDPNANRQ
jgi:DNA-binding CsgD family transcriptional regulator/tetratricopeptide (TPR) repeat protein